VITASAVVNAASSLPSVAPGALVAIYGSNLSETVAYAEGTPLPVSLGGVTVLVNNVPAPLLFVSPSQINTQLPFELRPGSASLVVQSGGISGAPLSFEVKPIAPGVLTVLLSRHALAQNAVDWSLNSAQNPARPGDYITIYTTGQGALENQPATGMPAQWAPLALPLAPVLARIGGVNAPVAFAGMTPGLVGVLQINLQIPAVPTGEQTLEVTIGGIAANTTLISVRGN
jgi:uncharacterized protein (TIGR03437 family)